MAARPEAMHTVDQGGGALKRERGRDTASLGPRRIVRFERTRFP